MPEVTLSFPDRGDIILPKKMSRTMYCKDCEKEIHIGKAKYILLHEGDHDHTQLFNKDSCNEEFELGYSPQLISNLDFKQFDDGRVKVYFKHRCGVEGCGYRIHNSPFETKKRIEYLKIHNKELYLEDFLKLCDKKNPKKYVNVRV
jgi:hypothetical protein